MKRTIATTLLATAFAVAGYSTNLHTEVNDSNKTVWYEIKGEVYVSQFYNTSQAILIEAFKFKDVRNIFSPIEIKYLSWDNMPTMKEIQKAILKIQDLEVFWEVIIEGDLWDDAAYLSIDTKYEHIYFENHWEALEFKASYDKHIKTYPSLSNLLTSK